GYEAQRVTLTVHPLDKNRLASRVDFKLQPLEVTVPAGQDAADPDQESLDILELIAAEARRIRLSEQDQEHERRQKIMNRLVPAQQNN
ncbi:carboxypeptidase N catalytic chain-like, partial [Tropilaelaps mercedesae]